MKRNIFKELDIVEVKKDGQHVKAGEIGTIVHVYPTGNDYEVEFISEQKVVLLGADEIKHIKNKDNASKRTRKSE